MFRLFLLIFLFYTQNAFSDVFLVPAHTIKKDSFVKADDFLYDDRPDKKGRGYWLESDAYELFHIQNAPPVKARRDLAKGQLIRKYDLFFASLKIKSGIKVQAKFVKNNLEIALPMMTLSSGKVGDIIKLQNLQGKVVRGKILENGTVVLQ